MWFCRPSFLIGDLGGCGLPAGVVFIVKTKGRLKTVGRFAANKLPANAVAVSGAAGFGVNQKAGNRMSAKNLKQRLGDLAGPVPGALGTLCRGMSTDFVERFQHRFLLF